MTTTHKTPVSVLGLGDMGRALAGALLGAGHPTTVWNRSADKADALVEQGAVRAASPADAVAASPLVIACLLDRASVHDVLDPAAAALSGKVLVNLTTSTPEDASELATWADKHDVAGFIDGGIMAVPSMIGGPDALILYSGSESGFSAHRDALEVFGTARYVGTEPGRSALLDLAMLHGMYGMFVGFFQAAAIVDTEAVEVTEFTTSLLMPWLEAMLSALPKYAADIDAGDYSGSESNLAMQASGMGFAEFAESIGANGELLAPLDRLMRQRVADGHGGDDLSSVFELIRKPSRRIN